MHDELQVMRSHLGPDNRPALLGELVDASWRAAMSALQLLVLNQAGFRPLNDEVGGWVGGGPMVPKRHLQAGWRPATSALQLMVLTRPASGP